MRIHHSFRLWFRWCGFNITQVVGLVALDHKSGSHFDLSTLRPAFNCWHVVRHAIRIHAAGTHNQRRLLGFVDSTRTPRSCSL